MFAVSCAARTAIKINKGAGVEGGTVCASGVNVTQASKSATQQLEALASLASFLAKLGRRGVLHIWTVSCAMPQSHNSCGSSHDATACTCKPNEGLLSTAEPALQLPKPLQIHRLQHAPLQLGSEMRRLPYMKLQVLVEQINLKQLATVKVRQ